jgi:O-antigen/teichoic acid export membrane protein
MKTRVLIRNVCANWLGLAVNMAIAFVMSPFLVHSLGDTMYGLWVLLLAVTGYMGLLEAGLKVSVVKYVSRFNAVSDTASINRVVSTVLVLHACVGAVIVAIAFLLGPVLPRMFSIPAEALPIANIVLMITAVNLAITLVASVFNGILAGLQRYDQANMIGVALVILRSVLVVLVISQGFGIVALGLVHTATQIVSGLLMMRLAFRNIDGLEVRWAFVNRQTVKMLYSYGSFVLLNNFAMFFLFNSGEILIGVFLSAAAVTYYAIAGSLLQYLSQLIGTMTQVLHPYASEQDAKADSRALQRIVVLGTKACMMIALPASLTFMLVGRQFTHLWMGANYAEVAGPLIVVLSIGRLFWLSQSSNGNVLLGAGRHKLLTITSLATGVAGIVLGSILIQKLGLFGLALGLTIPMVVTQGLILPSLTVRTLSVPPGEYLREGYLQPLVATIPYALALAALMLAVRPGSLIALGLTVFAALPLLAAGMYFGCLSPLQRQMIWQASAKWLPRPAPEGLR